MCPTRFGTKFSIVSGIFRVFSIADTLATMLAAKFAASYIFELDKGLLLLGVFLSGDLGPVASFTDSSGVVLSAVWACLAMAGIYFSGDEAALFEPFSSVRSSSSTVGPDLAGEAPRL